MGIGPLLLRVISSCHASGTWFAPGPDRRITLDEQEHQGRGPESRWSLARLLQRAEEGVGTSEAVHWRCWHWEDDSYSYLGEFYQCNVHPAQWRTFMRGRQFTTIFTDGLDAHLLKRLQPGQVPDHHTPSPIVTGIPTIRNPSTYLRVRWTQRKYSKPQNVGNRIKAK